MIVVADTSPLWNLNLVGRLELLHLLFGEVFVPPSVAGEAGDPRSAQPLDLRRHSWVRIEPPTTPAPTVVADLDAGERDAITLALELGAGRIVIDEKQGRHRATQLGLEVVGILGVLLASKARGHISEVRPILEELRSKAGFRVSDRLVRKVLAEAGEA